MHRTLPERPEDTPDTYIAETPAWLVWIFRSVLMAAGCATAVLLAQHWRAMPWPACLIAVSLSPALVAWALWSRPWRYMVRFIANGNGMYFPAYPGLLLSREAPPPVTWLEVPWQHISNIRLAREVDESGRSVALDIEASADEATRFFGAVGIPQDRRERHPAKVFAAYGGWPPSPAKTLAQLQRLKTDSGA